MRDNSYSPPTADDHDRTGPGASTRSVFWASTGFYVLIAFEFFYMASPFATYFYAVYGPGMDGLQDFGLASWTLWFFLPHIVVHTRSPIIDHAEIVGFVLFGGGIVAFAIGAFQVYSAKLFKRGAVTGGLYATTRHPQYTALMVASIGMALIWPRFLVLFATVAVVFAYIGLARIEEADCLRRYPGYAAYRARTGMFVPRRWTAWLPNLNLRLEARWQCNAVWAFAIIAALVFLSATAFGIRKLAISSLITHRTDAATYLSVTRITDADLARVASIAEAAPATRVVLDGLPAGAAVLAYVLPTQMYISEIPMHLPAGEQFGHTIPRDADPDRWKIVFTRAILGAGAHRAAGDMPDGDIIARAVNKHPLVEVHVDLASSQAGDGALEASLPPPLSAFYDGRQVPVF